MKTIRAVFLAGFVALYGCIFVAQDQKAQTRAISLEFALPVNFHVIASGYLKQLAAEMLFIKASVFLGGRGPDTHPASYEDVLGNNFEVMTSLYPRFIDPYYFCQSSLARISPEAASQANTILETGITAYPQDLILRFYYATNFFLSMNEPLRAARAFAEGAKIPDAPTIFAHLAALLSAKGGDIAAGIISLKTMLATEKVEAARIRYQKEIAIFEQALEVQNAVNLYLNKYGTSPKILQQLVPEFLPNLPEIKDSFTLVYDPPTVRLQRPDRAKMDKTGIPWK